MQPSRLRVDLLALCACAVASAGTAFAEAAARSAYYGDLHLHTSYSTDAVFLGAEPIALDDVYRFARGEAIEYRGQRVQRAEPLDFIAVTDHAEQLGLGHALVAGSGPLAETALARVLRAGGRATPAEIGALFASAQPLPGIDVAPILADAWQAELAAVKRHDRPGSFTTFAAYEWTSFPDAQNLHRNVIFRGDDAPQPFSSADSPRPEDLWSWLEANRARGIEALAIPHNANVSNGLMYAPVDSDGKPIDRRHAERRAQNEPLGEIVQTKGQSETHPLLSPRDELARFELFERLIGTPRDGRVPGSYFRDAWGRGLALAAQLGANPFAFGVAGGSDNHNNLSDTREETYRGPAEPPNVDADRARVLLGLAPDPNPSISILATGSGGLTGVWAESNTRDAIFAALRRKETFATSGTRIGLRMFGGWDLAPELFSDPNWVAAADRHGVPMGGTLGARQRASAAPRIAVQALRDPKGAGLARLQLIKVWLVGGEPHEQVFDLARAPAASAAQGASELRALFTDPDFDAAAPALYYARALEVPTPRWSARLARARGLPLPAGAPERVQERAWSSPIWYQPGERWAGPPLGVNRSPE
jgi:hypothetical protein